MNLTGPSFATLNLLAFTCRTQIANWRGKTYRAPIGTAETRQEFFQHLRSITIYLMLP